MPLFIRLKSSAFCQTILTWFKPVINMTTVNACVQKQGEILDDYSIPLDHHNTGLF